MVTKNKSVKAKKQPTISKKPNNKTVFQAFIEFAKTHKLLMLGLVVILAVIVWYLTLQIIIIRERNQLNKAESSLEQFTSELQNIFGYDIDFDQNKSCGYRSTVYVTIPNNPSCGISYSGQIPVTSAVQATEYAEKIFSALNSNFEIVGRQDGKFKDGENSGTLFSKDYGFSYKVSNLKCGLKIIYEDPAYELNRYLENHEIKISYHCTDPDSHKAFYTVLD